MWPPPSGKNSAVRQKIGGKSLKLVIFNRNFMSSSIQFCIKIDVFVKIFLKIWLAKTWHHTCLKANCKAFQIYPCNMCNYQACRICTFRTKWKPALGEYMKRKHKDKTYYCVILGFEQYPFAQQFLYINALCFNMTRYSHINNPCDICDKKYSSLDWTENSWPFVFISETTID